MMRLFKIISCFCAFFFLAGCQDESSYLYWMKHPEEFKTALRQCDTRELNPEKQRKCADLIYFSAHINDFLQEYENDPELFGETLLTAQQQLSVLSTTSNPDQQVAYLELQRKVALMSAIVGMHSPE